MSQYTTYDIRIFTNTLKETLDIDLTEYASAFLRYRLKKFTDKWAIQSLDNLIIRLKENELLLNKFLAFISVETTEMFRDPAFWRVFQKEVLQKHLAKRDIINILVPFFTTDDELFTLLVLLKENNLLDKVEIIATTPFNINIANIKSNKFTEKKYNLNNENYKRYTQNPDVSIENYFIKEEQKYIFSPYLLERVKFVRSDIINNSFGSEQQFDLILFRNRMLYFNLELQNKVLEHLFYYLSHRGFLVTGFKENISNFIFVDRLKQIDKKEKIFMKLK